MRICLVRHVFIRLVPSACEATGSSPSMVTATILLSVVIKYQVSFGEFRGCCRRVLTNDLPLYHLKHFVGVIFCSMKLVAHHPGFWSPSVPIHCLSKYLGKKKNFQLLHYGQPENTCTDPLCRVFAKHGCGCGRSPFQDFCRVKMLDPRQFFRTEMSKRKVDEAMLIHRFCILKKVYSQFPSKFGYCPQQKKRKMAIEATEITQVLTA